MQAKGNPNFFFKTGFFLLYFLSCLVPGCDQSPQKQSETTGKKVYDGLIVAMGDSLTAGHGVSDADSYPALLEKQLQDSGLNYQVINAGISGETSTGARARCNWVLSMKPDIVILETGANDGLRGIAPDLVKNNIKEIIETLLAHDVGVVLTGMQMVANLGPDYLKEFNRIYPELGSKYPIVYVPFFLKDVATVQALNQPDAIHPNAEGYQVITANLLPYIKQAITEHQNNAGAGIVKE